MRKYFRNLKQVVFGVVFLLLLILSSCIPSDSPKTTEAPSFVPLTVGAQIIWGRVLGGGDQTPEGLLDAPRTFVYQVLLDSGEEINVSYTTYPPSPSSQDLPGPQLTFYNGTISDGDYIVAQGNYDLATRTLNVVLESDFIETFFEKP